MICLYRLAAQENLNSKNYIREAKLGAFFFTRSLYYCLEEIAARYSSCVKHLCFTQEEYRIVEYRIVQYTGPVNKCFKHRRKQASKKHLQRHYRITTSTTATIRLIKKVLFSYDETLGETCMVCLNCLATQESLHSENCIREEISEEHLFTILRRNRRSCVRDSSCVTDA